MDRLEEVLRLSDPVGVLSVYVRARDAATPGSAAIHALEVDLRRVMSRIDSSWAPDARRARTVLETIERRVHDAAARGEARNLVLFAALGADRIVALEPVGEVPTRSTVGPRADVRPLCLALEESRPAGVALVSAEGVRVLEWTPGALAEVWSATLPELEQRDLVGPAHAHPRGLPGTAPEFKAGQQRDLFKARVRLELEQLLASAAAKTAELARERGWHEIVLAGQERLGATFARCLPSGASVEIALAPRIERWRSLGDLALRVAPAIARAREQRTIRLVRKVLEAAGGGGLATVGVRETLAALAEGRVDTLLVVAERPIAGRSSAAGLLAAPGDIPPGGSAAELVDDPMLADAMIARAIDTDTTIVVLPPELAQLLGGEDVAALLRY